MKKLYAENGQSFENNTQTEEKSNTVEEVD